METIKLKAEIVKSSKKTSV